jgi:hypothetical protein
MAVTSLWAVRGNLGGVLDYAANPEKTKNLNFHRDMDLINLLRYATQQRKTTSREEGAPVKQFVTGIHCDPTTARQEMQAVKKRFGKEKGVIAYHGYQSFAPGECTPELAHEIGVKLAQQVWGDKYQVLVATHLDRENHLHSHFVINTVSFVDGKKFYRSGQDYRAMREVSDSLCREYGLSVIENPQQGKTKHYAEHRAEQQGKPTWRSLIQKDVDAALRQSMTERQFFHALQGMGYQVKVGADISVRPQGKERFFRLGRNLGESYAPMGIRRRLLKQNCPEREYCPEPRKLKFHGQLKPARKATGFRALYYHYCYLLGIFPRNKRRWPRRVSLALREELLRGNRFSQEVRLLSQYKIETVEQLEAHQGKVKAALDEMISQRTFLYRQLRTVAIQSDSERRDHVKQEITTLTGQIKKLRKEVVLCDDIAQRSKKMRENLEQNQIKSRNKGHVRERS